MTFPDCVSSNPIHQWRIMVVENDLKQRSNLSDLLAGWGYEVIEAEGLEGSEVYHESLTNDVFAKADSHHCHVLIIDIRLESDEDERDCSGGELARQLVAKYPLLHVIFRSGYPRPASLANWRFVGKGDGAEALRLLVEETVAHIQEFHQGSGA